MSSDKAGQEQKDAGGGGEPAPAKRPQPPNSRLQALVEEYRRNNAQTDRREQSRDQWARAIAIGGILTTLLTLAVAYTGWRQFLLAQNQAQVQLRPYVTVTVTVTVDEIPSIVEGQKLQVRLHHENVGNTPVYAATLHPFFAFVTDKTVPSDKIVECEGMSSRGYVFAKRQNWAPTSDFTINRAQMDLLKAGVAEIVFFARLCYYNVFEEVNWTDLCIYWSRAGDDINYRYCNNVLNQMVSNGRPKAGGDGSWLTRLLPQSLR